MSTINKYFPLPLRAEYIGNGIWELLEPFIYDNPPVKVELPIKFRSDGASIPQIVYSLIGGRWTGKYVLAALIHDYLRSIAVTPEDYKKADEIFLKIMEILGVTLWRRRIMWRAVRAQAWTLHKLGRLI